MVAAITAVGAAFRFATIASQSYWFDEATTAHAVQLSFGGLLHVVRTTESTPPLYYVVAWVWAKVFGAGEAGLRSLSAVAGTALIPIAYLCGRELLSRADNPSKVLLIHTALTPGGATADGLIRSAP